MGEGYLGFHSTILATFPTVFEIISICILLEKWCKYSIFLEEWLQFPHKWLLWAHLPKRGRQRLIKSRWIGNHVWSLRITSQTRLKESVSCWLLKTGLYIFLLNVFVLIILANKITVCIRTEEWWSVILPPGSECHQSNHRGDCRSGGSMSEVKRKKKRWVWWHKAMLGREAMEEGKTAVTIGYNNTGKCVTVFMGGRNLYLK